jgi:uncharacterized protein (DUF3084 family)
VGTLSHQNKILAETNYFRLVQRKRNDRKWYEVKVISWSMNFKTEREIRDFFDPLRNKAGKWGTTWKYSNRKDAEQMFLTATLRWA